MSVSAKRYEGAEPYIFISYSHADSERVLSIVAAMEKRGYRVWYDANITAGEQWTAALANKIADCEIFMPFISRAFRDSKNCIDEVQHAKRNNRTFVPIRFNLERELFSQELKFLLTNAQGFSLASHDEAAFHAWMDFQSIFQCCRAVTTQTSAPLAEIVTQSC